MREPDKSLHYILGMGPGARVRPGSVPTPPPAVGASVSVWQVNLPRGGEATPGCYE